MFWTKLRKQIKEKHPEASNTKIAKLATQTVLRWVKASQYGQNTRATARGNGRCSFRPACTGKNHTIKLKRQRVTLKRLI